MQKGPAPEWESTTTVAFYRGNKKNGELSNFYIHNPPLSNGPFREPIKTIEALYQAFKYRYPDAPECNALYARRIMQANTPYMAKLLANRTRLYKYEWQHKLNAIMDEFDAQGVKPREDWESHKLNAMRQCLEFKFQADETCRNVLMATGCKLLIENSKTNSVTDKFWGKGADGLGQNHLGKLLMEVRENLFSNPWVYVTSCSFFQGKRPRSPPATDESEATKKKEKKKPKRSRWLPDIELHKGSMVVPKKGPLDTFFC